MVTRRIWMAARELSVNVRDGYWFMIAAWIDVAACLNAAAGASRMVPDEGIEPPTFGLQNRCSTAELIRPYGLR